MDGTVGYRRRRLLQPEQVRLFGTAVVKDSQIRCSWGAARPKRPRSGPKENRSRLYRAYMGTLSDTVNGQTSWSNGVTYTYDLAGQLTGEADASGTAGFQYNSAGERTQMTQPNGEVTTYGHDAGGRLTSVQIAYGTGSQANYVYGYDPAGNRVSEVTPAGTYKYTYDALNRLSGALRAKIEETLDPR